jgi:hypothetical protein
VTVDVSAALDAAQGLVEGLMDGAACRVTRDESQREDDTLDPDTLELVPPDPDAGPVYDGPCTFTRISGTEAAPAHDRSAYTEQRWRVSVPLAAPPLKVNDRIVLTKCKRMPDLVGREFRVDELVESGSYAVSRKALLVMDDVGTESGQ